MLLGGFLPGRLLLLRSAARPRRNQQQDAYGQSCLLYTSEKDGKIVDVKISYPADYVKQMLGYSKDYSFLPNIN